MPLSLQAISRLLPPGVPDVPLAEPALPTFREIEGGSDNPLGRSFMWSQYILHVYRDYFWPVVEHFQVEPDPIAKTPQQINPSVGFFPIDRHIYTHASRYLPTDALDLGFFFGAVIYDRRWRPPSIPPYLLPTTPVMVMQYPAAFVAHAPLDPANAAATSWASDPSNTQGILTCKHAVAGLSRGSNVAMKDGSTGQLIDFAPGSVDAAFVETQNGVPANAASLAIESHPVNGSTVSADFRSRHVGNAQILNSWYFHDNLDPYNAMRVYIDHWGQPSDSGSLVADASSKGVGMYTGTLTANGTQQGMCQYLLQGVDLLHLNVFA